MEIRVGTGAYPYDRGPAIVTNISRLLDYLKCEEYFANRYVKNRVLARPDAAPLALGTSTHKAIEQLHTTTDVWAPTLATGIADSCAKELFEASQSPTLSPREAADYSDWADWLQEIIPEYAAKHRKPSWEKTLMVEQEIWIEYEFRPTVTAERIVFVGRVDSIRTKMIGREWLVHWQIKTVSSQVSIPDFIQQQKFSPHELVYTDWMQHAVLAGILPNLPVYGSVLDLLRKVKKPAHPDTILPPKELAPQGPKTTDESYKKKQQEHAEKTVRWRERVAKKTLEYTEWRSAALHQEPIYFTTDFREGQINRLLVAAHRANKIKEGSRLPLCAWGIACTAYHRLCDYIGPCNGTMRLDGLPFGDRTPDYVDKMGEDNGDLC